MKRKLTFCMMLVLLCSLFAGCSRKQANGKVYYLNADTELDAAWQSLSKKYTEKTGVEVEVLTPAKGQYDETLTAEMEKSDAPTLFRVNGPAELAKRKNECIDLSDTAVYKELKNESFALQEDGKVYGIPYAVESYGILYNKELLERYFASDFATVKKVEDINNFDSFSKVVREIQAHKDELGIDGAFASTGMSTGRQYKNYLANLPLYYEYADKKISMADKIEGTYLDGYKQIWDLYINNATVEPAALSDKTEADAQTEFKTGKAVFYQSGTWDYSGLKEEDGVGLKDEQLGMLPIYIGVAGEEQQGLCTGSENYWCVSSKASEADKQATLDFLHWLVTDETGTEALAEDMGFVIPYKQAKSGNNPLVTIAEEYMTNGKTPVGWSFTTVPSEDWISGVGTALGNYATGKGNWDAVQKAFTDNWETEYKKANG